MESKSGLLTYGKDYMNTSVFLSDEDAAIKSAMSLMQMNLLITEI